MKTYRVMTSKRGGRLWGKQLRNYGYVVAIYPPIEYTVDTMDVEGIGMVSIAPRKHVQHYQGWYKYKKDALQRCEELTKCANSGL
jgi:hypothetical protein